MSTATETAGIDLTGLRSFVTVVLLEDLMERPAGLAGYFGAFGPDDDATLLIFAGTIDAAGAVAATEAVFAAAGVDPQACADVELIAAAPDARTLDRITRRANAALGSTTVEALTMQLPSYGWEDAARLREHADRVLGLRGQTAPYSYDAAIAHLVQRGWTSAFHVTQGSIPEASLQRLGDLLDGAGLGDGPRVLHVGNFVGISLSYLLNWATGTPRGRVVSVDPNIPHRDVTRPQDAVCDLLAHFGLAQRHLLICGYSLEKSLSNDGVVFEGYDPAVAWAAEAAPEHVLRTLAEDGSGFDVALIDGNHDPAYLRRELEALTALLRPGGILVLDDVDEWWEGIQALFAEVASGDVWPYEPLLADGRIGVLRRI